MLVIYQKSWTKPTTQTFFDITFLFANVVKSSLLIAAPLWTVVLAGTYWGSPGLIGDPWDLFISF